MLQQKIATDTFGEMALNVAAHAYQAGIDLPYMRSGEVSISSEEFEVGLKRMEAFLVWLEVNHDTFKLVLEREIENYDLVWDEVWDSILGKDWVHEAEGFLVPYLNYKKFDFTSGAIHMWINTSGLHTDHMVRVTMNQAMQIECCEVV
jgi:hypothetical protein